MVGRRKKAWRRGTTVVETAIVFPVLVLVTVGAIHYGWLFLKAQQITNAARVAVRMAILPDTTIAVVEAHINALFSPAGANINVSVPDAVKFYKTEVDPDTGEPMLVDGNPVLTEIFDLAQSSGVPITVTITVPRASVDFMNTTLLPTPANLTASATMAKEGT
jgi:Flp pilus assembly protein TadG